MIRDADNFVPRGARRVWPFLIGRGQSYCAPPPNARRLLWQGLFEAIAGRQPTESRENWRTIQRDFLATLMRKEGAGPEHPSRIFVASLIESEESVLDVGCGAGAGYESLSLAGKAHRYVGVDSSEPSVEVARELYPSGDFREGNAIRLRNQFEEAGFDVVVVRHVLEHLPDFLPAMEQAIAVSRRLAVFVFFLTPRLLPFGVRKLDAGLNRPALYTYIYSRRAIDRFLARSGLYRRWYDDIGISRAGWLANEPNSVLIVSREPLE